MKPGDQVWVEVSRDRERLGEFKRYLDSHKEYCSVEVAGDTGMYETTKLRAAPEGSPGEYGRPIESDPGDPTVALKHDGGKTRLELIPVSGIEGIGRAMTYGSKKYSDHNWANGFKYSRLIGSALRHLMAYISGEDTDPESGLSHLDHFGACAVMLIAHKEEGLGEDDRRKTVR